MACIPSATDKTSESGSMFLWNITTGVFSGKLYKSIFLGIWFGFGRLPSEHEIGRDVGGLKRQNFGKLLGRVSVPWMVMFESEGGSSETRGHFTSSLQQAACLKQTNLLHWSCLGTPPFQQSRHANAVDYVRAIARFKMQVTGQQCYCGTNWSENDPAGWQIDGFSLA